MEKKWKRNGKEMEKKTIPLSRATVDIVVVLKTKKEIQTNLDSVNRKLVLFRMGITALAWILRIRIEALAAKPTDESKFK